ncbi:MAG: LacI family DNA-binding transcriptional regulator [Hyphomicrobiaceae bacterium]|nr:LacI family DNA-binding transcriptional regulator [Hyphomicrobiaceae bacterium]
MAPLPTLEDVASRAGVSTATVSRCLNSPEKVVDHTREKVMSAVDELGYTPHFGGRALASRTTNTAGAVIPTMDNAIFACALQAFQKELASAGMTLLVASSDYSPSHEFEQICTLVERGADGLLLIGADRPKTSYDYLDKRGIPYVVAWTNHSDQAACCVGFDNRLAAKRMAEHVIAHGHRNIAMISGITEGNDRAAERVHGVRDALADAEINPDAFKVVEVNYSLDAAGRAFDKLITTSPPPTAVVCGNDVLAAGAVTRAKARGLRVPKDISIVGFDDIELASVIEPKLTTVHVPHRRMGVAAAKCLLDMRELERTIPGREFMTEIIERESLGPVNR